MYIGLTLEVQTVPISAKRAGWGVRIVLIAHAEALQEHQILLTMPAGYPVICTVKFDGNSRPVGQALGIFVWLQRAMNLISAMSHSHTDF